MPDSLGEEFVRYYDGVSSQISEIVRMRGKQAAVSEMDGVMVEDMALLRVFIYADENGDADTSEVARIILEERGYHIPG